mmetsp:Transcript_7262/g.12280  ORF Transcript_7262/g.12280 Transcript_7262/m.12280 type:complete len:214 (+) Transcript_7262:1290-1931(+)
MPLVVKSRHAGRNRWKDVHPRSTGACYPWKVSPAFVLQHIQPSSERRRPPAAARHSVGSLGPQRVFRSSACWSMRGLNSAIRFWPPALCFGSRFALRLARNLRNLELSDSTWHSQCDCFRPVLLRTRSGSSLWSCPRLGDCTSLVRRFFSTVSLQPEICKFRRRQHGHLLHGRFLMRLQTHALKTLRLQTLWHRQFMHSKHNNTASERKKSPP